MKTKGVKFWLKQHGLSLLIGLLFLSSLSLALYPEISSRINQSRMSVAIEQWRQQESTQNSKQTEEMWHRAEDYNALLKNEQFPFDPDQALHDQYLQTLSNDRNGLMGALTVPAVDLQLPIYHGTDNATLHRGLGHLEGSSLPLGNKGEHALITGHSGMAGTTMFDHLDALQTGDTFSIEILDRKLTYRTTRIEKVLPEEYRNVNLDPNQSLVTLVTCTPYGVNSHRLLVTGSLTDTQIVPPLKKTEIQNSHPPAKDHASPAIAIALIAMILAGCGILWWKSRRSGQ